MMKNLFEINVTLAKKEIRKAQQRLRRAPDFMKEVAINKGFDRLTTKGNAEELLMNWRKATTINNTEQFTKSGFKKFQKELAEDTRLDIKTIKYAMENINAQNMDYIKNSRLRYGSNPQLDYILDTTNEIANSLEIAMDEIKALISQIPLDIF